MVFRLEDEEFRVVRVPADWRRDPIRVRKLDDDANLLEREDLLASIRIDPPLEEED